MGKILLSLVAINSSLLWAYAISYWIPDDGTVFYFMICELFVLWLFWSLLFTTFVVINHFNKLN